MAVSLALRLLLDKAMIKRDIEADFNGEEYAVFMLLPEGDSWIIENQNMFAIKQESTDQKDSKMQNDKDLPF